MGVIRRRKIQVGLLAALVLLAMPLAQSLTAQETVDLTLLFHSAVQGKIAPCG